jgi:hypothetical protein
LRTLSHSEPAHSYSAPTLARQIEQKSNEAADAGIPPAAPSYSPQILDLLLELSTLSEYQAPAEWPPSVRRARTVQEALDAVAGGRFDVVVIDDAPDFSAVDFRQIGASPTVHRLGGAAREIRIFRHRLVHSAEQSR